MSTNIRPEIKKEKPYHIEKHRYYELVHFCRQYYIWKRKYYSLNEYGKVPVTLNIAKDYYISDNTAKLGIDKALYKVKMDMVEKCAIDAGGYLSSYLFKGVTEGIGYNRLNPPCSKTAYYDIYRKFFYILNFAKE